jgi:hypothetical protein
VSDFRKQLSSIVAEETYRQELTATSRFSNNLLVNPPRVLKSDLLLIKPGDADRYVELRDVFEKDGEPVRDREARLEALLVTRREPRAAASPTSLPKAPNTTSAASSATSTRR